MANDSIPTGQLPAFDHDRPLPPRAARILAEYRVIRPVASGLTEQENIALVLGAARSFRNTAQAMRRLSAGELGRVVGDGETRLRRSLTRMGQAYGVLHGALKRPLAVPPFDPERDRPKVGVSMPVDDHRPVPWDRVIDAIVARSPEFPADPPDGGDGPWHGAIVAAVADTIEADIRETALEALARTVGGLAKQLRDVPSVKAQRQPAAARKAAARRFDDIRFYADRAARQAEAARSALAGSRASWAREVIHCLNALDRVLPGVEMPAVSALAALDGAQVSGSTTIDPGCADRLAELAGQLERSAREAAVDHEMIVAVYTAPSVAQTPPQHREQEPEAEPLSPEERAEFEQITLSASAVAVLEILRDAKGERMTRRSIADSRTDDPKRQPPDRGEVGRVFNEELAPAGLADDRGGLQLTERGRRYMRWRQT